MPAKKRLTMRQLRTLLRLKHGGAGLSDRTSACQIGVARSTIQEYLARVEAAGLSWPLPDDLTDEALDRLLFPRSGCRPGFRPLRNGVAPEPGMAPNAFPGLGFPQASTAEDFSGSMRQ